MSATFRLEEWEVRPQTNELVSAAGTVRVEPRVMRVLEFLATRPGEVVSREALISVVWDETFVSDEVLTNAIRELRKAIGDDAKKPRYLQTIPKKGYKLVARVEPFEKAPAAVRSGRLRGLWLGLGIALFAVIGASLLLRLPRERQKDVVRFVLDVPDDDFIAVQATGPALSVSPDGSRIVYVGSASTLYHRAIDSVETIALPGTVRGKNPFFSPDGEWVAFFADGQLKKARVAGGGTAIILCDAAEGMGGSWGDGDTILFTPRWVAGLARVAASGGEPEIVLRAEPMHEAAWPHFLPGGRRFLYTEYRGLRTSITGFDLKTGERRVVTQGVSPAYASGHLVFARGDVLFAARFDPDSFELESDPLPVVTNLRMDPNFGAEFALSAGGTLVHVTGGAGGGEVRRLVLVDRDGTRRRLVEEPREYRSPRVSPDGSRLAMTVVENGNWDLWSLSLETKELRRLTVAPGIDLAPTWSDDGKSIVYGAYTGRGDGELTRIFLEEDREPLTLYDNPDEEIPRSWSRDRLVFSNAGGLHWMNPEEGADPERLPDTTRRGGAALSPDGEWLATIRTTPGDGAELHLQRFPRGGRVWEIAQRATEPVWSRDGRELFFYRRASRGWELAVVEIETESAPSWSEPRRLFRDDWSAPSGLSHHPNYDVLPDGSGFVMVEAEPPVTEFQVTVNWIAELERSRP